jgi:hypothetical protein
MRFMRDAPLDTEQVTDLGGSETGRPAECNTLAGPI